MAKNIERPQMLQNDNIQEVVGNGDVKEISRIESTNSNKIFAIEWIASPYMHTHTSVQHIKGFTMLSWVISSRNTNGGYTYGGYNPHARNDVEPETSSIVFHPDNQPMYWSSGNQHVHFIHYYIPQETFENVTRDIYGTAACLDDCKIMKSRPPHLMDYFKKIREISNERMMSELELECWTQLIAREAAINYIPHKIKNGKTENSYIAFSNIEFQLIKDYIHSNYHENISLTDLLGVTGYSNKYHFIRRFKSTHGMTPHQYLITTRINAARNLLENSKLAISQISLECGFSNQQHMTSVFKKYFDTTPLKFRKEVTISTVKTNN